METVTVGCRLPNGLVLEVGFSVSQKANGGAPFAMFVKHENYQSFRLRGTNQRLIIRDQTRKPIAVLPNSREREAVMNEVPKELWEAWVKANAKSWHLSSGQIFVVPKNDPSTIKAAVVDASAKSKPIFQAMDPKEVVKLEDVTISQYETEKE